MLFHTYQRRNKTFVPIINNTNIEKVEEFNLFGIDFGHALKLENSF